MKNIVLFTMLTLIAFSAIAGVEFESIKTDISSYLQEQNKTPNHIIRYSDANGESARLVLNPARVDKVIVEISDEINQVASSKALVDIYKPVAENYERAFKEVPGKYDAEYLDMEDSMFRVMMASIKPFQSIDINQIQNKDARVMMEGLQKMMKPLPGLILNSFEQQIKANKFSPEFTPIALARLDTLKKLQSTETSITVIPSKAVRISQYEPSSKQGIISQNNSNIRVFVSSSAQIGKAAFIELSQDVNKITKISLPKSGFQIMTIPHLEGASVLQVCASNSTESIRKITSDSSIEDSGCFSTGTGMAMPIAKPPRNEVPLIISNGDAHNYYNSQRRVDETNNTYVNISSAYARDGSAISGTYFTVYIDKNHDGLINNDELWFAKITWK